MSGDFIYRHHEVLGTELCIRDETTFFISIEYVDVMRHKTPSTDDAGHAEQLLA